MIKLTNVTTGAELGQINDDELQFLIDQMEEEFLEDRDYAITPLTLSYFEGLNASPRLMELLRQGLGEREETIIRWMRA